MAYSIAFYIDSVPFRKQEISGEGSLGGSESACLGLARALRKRGHDVHIFATKLDEDCEGPDQAGVQWHDYRSFADMSQYTEWDLFCSLRMAAFFAGDLVNARLRWLWNQDLLQGEPQHNLVMASSYQVDRFVYVSEYHRHQWESQLPQLKPFGWVTKNGYDPALVPTDVVKDPYRVIHISRPERAYDAILQMWPEIRKREPKATLALCRYTSMYDAAGWGKICEAYDRKIERMNEEAGGVIWLGELGKAQLYQEIAKAAVMWYPGIATFAETSCIAAIEAQACGTPFVGSYRGALPETVPHGVLTEGNPDDPDYQRESVAAVLGELASCRMSAAVYRSTQKLGRDHVKAYTFDRIAEEWEQEIGRSFSARLESEPEPILRRLMHDDDHVAAEALAWKIGRHDDAEFCRVVIDGKHQTAEDYAAHAMSDPVKEGDTSGRLQVCSGILEGRKRLLDVACGNGAFALRFLRDYPDATVIGLDYSEGNIDAAKRAAESLGLSDRATFICYPIYDFETHDLADVFKAWIKGFEQHFDAMFVGEFLEHCANSEALVDGLEMALEDDGVALYTFPNGPFTELMSRGVPIKRGHVHRFCHDDVRQVFGAKRGLDTSYMESGYSARGRPVGSWIIKYLASGKGGRARARDVQSRIQSARPYPRLTVGILGKNVEETLGHCLGSIWPIADEILYGDTGSSDKSKSIANDYGATAIDLAPIADQPEGFAGARNQLLGLASGEWFLWIDADEVLVGMEHLCKYIDSGGPMNGFVIKQQHFYMDQPSTFDIPVRLFRKRDDIRFYGVVHEQPQQGDCNGEIFPVLQIEDVRIAHFGYLTEGIRQEKMGRNLPFLKKDRDVFPDRELGHVLVLRDFVNLALHERKANRVWTDKTIRWLINAATIFDAHFKDPAHRFHGIARPYYETAIKTLHAAGVSEAFEMEIALGGKSGGMGQKVAVKERVWVRDMAEYETLVAHRVKKMVEQRTQPEVDTEPYRPQMVEAESSPRGEVAVS